MGFAETVIGRIVFQIVDPIIYLLFAAALILFLWGGFNFIANADSEEGRTIGKRNLIWGLVGMIIMISAYAILWIAANTFGIRFPQ